MNTMTDGPHIKNNNEDLIFPYLDKNEAMFLLSLLKNVDCTHCPCFSMRCDGNYTIAQLANMPLKEYLFKQKKGTESYMCGKLRNIIISEEIQWHDINDGFDKALKNKIGYLHKNFEKCFINSVNQDIELKHIEQTYQKQLQNYIDETQKKIMVLQETINKQKESLIHAERKIQCQIREIKKIKDYNE